MRPNRLLAARPLLFSHRLLLPIGALLALAGYFRPWISHQAAGLAVLGLDLAELVKLMYPIQQGDIRLWREGFYLPLVAVSASLSLNAFRRDPAGRSDASAARAGGDYAWTRPAYGWPLRVALLLLAIAAALNLLPPAWTPRQLLTPDYRLQLAALLLCLALAAVSPLAALFLTPRSLLEAVGRGGRDGTGRGWLWQAARLAALLRALLTVALTGAALYFPLFQFRWILPVVADLYGQTPTTGWGPGIMSLGLAGLLLHGLGDSIKAVNIKTANEP